MAKGFVCVTFCVSSFDGLGEKRFKFLTIRVLPLPLQNEIQLVSRFFCYLKLVCLFGFGLKRASPRNSTRVKASPRV